MAKGSPYSLQFQKSDTLAAQMLVGATSFTLTNGNFGTPTGTQLYVIDYDVPASAEVVSATVAATAGTSVVRALDGTSAVQHEIGAKVGAFFVPSHLTALKPNIATSDTFSAVGLTTSTYTSIGMNKSFTTTGGQVVAYFSIVVQTTSAGSAFFQVRLKRGATVLRTSSIVGADVAQSRNPYSASVIETPAAGTYTYNMEISNVNGVGTMNVADANLLLMEFAT